MPNFDNLGIATALNIGCEKALEEGFEWCMTMDQDSNFSEEMIEKYLKTIYEYRSEKNVSFAPSCIYKNSKPVIDSTVETIRLGLKKNKSLLAVKRKVFSKLNIYQDFSEKKETENVKRVITSGNVIHLHVWKDIGKFNENLFIDEVDFDFCYRLIKSSYNILQFNFIAMEHILGNVKENIVSGYTHSDVRLYYITRNNLWIMKKYPEFAKEFTYSKNMRKLFFENILSLNWKNLTWMVRGIRDFRHNVLGQYEHCHDSNKNNGIKYIIFFLPERLSYPIGGYKVVYEYANRLSKIGYSIKIIYAHTSDFIKKNKFKVFKSKIGYLYRRFFKHYKVKWF